MASLAKLLTCVQAKMKRDRNKALMHCPKGLAFAYAYIQQRQKPNSGLRKVAKIQLSNNRKS
jgi:ribosomal protein S12